jgi:hypothetical protein
MGNPTVNTLLPSGYFDSLKISLLLSTDIAGC